MVRAATARLCDEPSSIILVRRSWNGGVRDYRAGLHMGALFRRDHRAGGRSFRPSVGTSSTRLLEWAHAPGYGILALLLIHGLRRRAWSMAYALPAAAAIAFVFGVCTEVLQQSVQGRSASLDDLVTDAIGIGLAALLMLSATIRNRMASPWLAPQNQNSVKGQAEG